MYARLYSNLSATEYKVFCARLKEIASCIGVDAERLREDDAVFAWGRKTGPHYEQQFGVIDELLADLVEAGHSIEIVNKVNTVRDYMLLRSLGL